MTPLSSARGSKGTRRLGCPIAVTRVHTVKKELPTARNEIDRLLEQLVQERDALRDIVLRGHLMVEQMLERSITVWFPQKGALEEARLGFHKKLCLVRGLNVRHPDEPLWRALAALNSLRNDFAHKLTSAQRDQRVRRFLHVTESDFPVPENERKKRKQLPIHLEVAVAFAYLLNSLNQISVEYESRARLAQIAGDAYLLQQYGWKRAKETANKPSTQE